MGLEPRSKPEMGLDIQEQNNKTNTSTDRGWQPKQKNQAAHSVSRNKPQQSTIVNMGGVTVVVSHPKLLKSLRPLPRQERRILEDYDLMSNDSMEDFDPWADEPRSNWITLHWPSVPTMEKQEPQ